MTQISPIQSTDEHRSFEIIQDPATSLWSIQTVFGFPVYPCIFDSISWIGLSSIPFEAKYVLFKKDGKEAVIKFEDLYRKCGIDPLDLKRDLRKCAPLPKDYIFDSIVEYGDHGPYERLAARFTLGHVDTTLVIPFDVTLLGRIDRGNFLIFLPIEDKVFGFMSLYGCYGEAINNEKKNSPRTKLRRAFQKTHSFHYAIKQISGKPIKFTRSSCTYKSCVFYRNCKFSRHLLKMEFVAETPDKR